MPPTDPFGEKLLKKAIQTKTKQNQEVKSEMTWYSRDWQAMETETFIHLTTDNIMEKLNAI